MKAFCARYLLLLCLALGANASWASGDVTENYCLPLEDVCNLQAEFARRSDQDIMPPYVLFDMPEEDAYLFIIDGEFVMVFMDKGWEQ